MQYILYIPTMPLKSCIARGEHVSVKQGHGCGHSKETETVNTEKIGDYWTKSFMVYIKDTLVKRRWYLEYVSSRLRLIVFLALYNNVKWNKSEM
jgi:hypothetical protein